MKKISFLIIAWIVIISGCHSPGNNGATQSNTTNHAIHDSTELAVAKGFFKVGNFIMSKTYDSALIQCDSFIAFLNKISAGNRTGKDSMYAGDISRLNALKMSIYDSLNNPAQALNAAFEALKWSKLANSFYLQCCDEYYVARESKNLASIKTDPAEKKQLAAQALQYSLLAQKHMDSTHVMTPDEIHNYFHTLDSGIHNILKN